MKKQKLSMSRYIYIFMILAILLFQSATLADDEENREYEIKAAFIYNFLQFVKFSPEQLEGLDSATICIIGQDPFGSAMDPLASKQALGKNIVIKKFSSPSEVNTKCLLTFVNAADASSAAEIISELKDHNSLIVGELDDFVNNGGIIGFQKKGTKIGMQINLSNAQKAHLEISSKLLALAEIVK